MRASSPIICIGEQEKRSSHSRAHKLSDMPELVYVCTTQWWEAFPLGGASAPSADGTQDGWHWQRFLGGELGALMEYQLHLFLPSMSRLKTACQPPSNRYWTVPLHSCRRRDPVLRGSVNRRAWMGCVWITVENLERAIFDLKKKKKENRKSWKRRVWN